MINKKRTINNAFFSISQVVVSGVSLFVIYKYLLGVLGSEKLGVWSIVMAMSTLAKISDLGFAGGMVKFVSKYTARREDDIVREVVHTGAVSIAVFVTGVAITVYLLIDSIAPKIFSGNNLKDAITLIPYALVSFGIGAVSGVFLSTLDGFQRTDIRNKIIISGSLINIMLMIGMVSKFGFVGLGYAQVSQTVFVLIFSWIGARKKARIKSVVPLYWNYFRFKEMLRYNVSLQVTTIAALLLEPTAKIMLGKFGDMSIVTYFEMANKLIMQFRSIIVSANQVLVPVISELKEKELGQIVQLYEKTYYVLYFVSVAMYSILAVMAPLVSEVWIGYENETFISILYMILIALFVNTLVGPVYFSNLGSGNVGLNAKSQVLTGLLNLMLSYCFGIFNGGKGVVVGYVLAILLGSIYLIISFQRAQKIKFTTLIPVGHGLYSIYAIMIISFLWILEWGGNSDVPDLSIVAIRFLLALLVVLLAARHELFRRILNSLVGKR